MENYENFDLNNLKVDHESEDEDLEEDLDDEAEEERQMSESDLSEDFKDKDYEPKSELSETPVRIKIKKEKKGRKDRMKERMGWDEWVRMVSILKEF